MSVLGGAGLPPDGASWAALLLALTAGVLALKPDVVSRFIERTGERRLVWALALVAALLSTAYIHYYLRGGPRIVDATSYFLEARALSHGQLNFETPVPSGAFRGRFLVTPADASSLSVIFPPGYPAYLALGFLLGAPLMTGPLLAALLVFATHGLARALFPDARLALLAALFSVLCAALRYHTADTMAHGLSALLLCTALLAATRGGRWLWLAGLAVGWLIATRPLSGIVAGLACLWWIRRELRQGLPILLGAVPGVALLLAHQYAATGSALSSSQLRYYALADGPPGCFRYGFGAGIGCVYEHGDFVRARLQDGYGLLAALGTSLRRLRWHSLDVANAEPLFLLLPVALVLGRRLGSVRLLAGVTAAIWVVYAPFYFDGSYPGGGARFFVDVLPLEHVLLAFGLLQLGWARFTPAVAMLGFALHASFEHQALREREGGRPMYEARVAQAAGAEHGLMLVGTDHGFNLGFDPNSDAKSGLLVARARGDAHDWVLWQRLGKPRVYRYDYDPFRPGAVPTVTPVELTNKSSALRFEAEHEWPPLRVAGGFAHPDFPAPACSKRSLRLRPDPGPVEVEFGLAVPQPGRYRVRATWVSRVTDAHHVDLGINGVHRPWSAELVAGRCYDGPAVELELGSAEARVRVTSDRDIDLDAIRVIEVK